jgi:neutral ceramidase
VKRAAWILVLWAGCARGDSTGPAGWKAGVARAKITPPGPLWMSGYGNRTRPAEGTLQDLWVKALAIEDPDGRLGLILTADLVGIDRELSGRICKRIGLPRESILIACSHTHTGPMVSLNLECMFDLPPLERERIADYATFLESAFVGVAAKAMASTAPAELSWGNGTARFAVNRRANPEKEVPDRIERGELKGPVDYDVPVLKIARARGPLQAVFFGYACHNTVLDFYQWSGDYAGFAQLQIETSHPGAAALFFMGCGADQNPLPRRKVELAQEYGGRLAAGVDRVLETRMEPVTGRLSTHYSILELPFARIPTEEELRKSLEDPKVPERRRAELLLAQLKRSGRVSPTYPYPVQVWRLGELTLAALGGEVVVDYSLRLKKELQEGRTWVAGYCNDVMAYIPSERVLGEGGYEGGGAMAFYGLPSPWAPGLEEKIIDRVKELAR